MILYHKESTLLTVNEARRHLFCKTNKSLENLPPTQDTLLSSSAHMEGYLSKSIWNTGQHSIQNVPTPEGWGWTKDENLGNLFG